MADDIEIGVDVSRAVRPLEQLLDSLNAIANVADNKTAKSLTAMEKSIANAAAKSGLFSTALKAEGRAMEEAGKKAEAYRRRIAEISGVNTRQMHGGTRYTDAATGQLIKTEEGLKRIARATEVVTEAERRASAENQNYQRVNAAKMSQWKQQEKDLDRAAELSAMRQHIQQRASMGQGIAEGGGTGLTGITKYKQAIMDASNSTRYLMYDVSNSLAIAGAATAAFGVIGVTTAVKWEKAFAAVQRTAGGTEAQTEQLRRSLVSMSQEIPVAFAELTEIAALGGQLGIRPEGIASFTETVAKLTATTNLTATAAGTALGRFKSFFATVEGGDQSLAVTQATFGNLASSILKVGINSVATETGIVNVATQISSMGSYAGMTAEQVIGLAGALSSVGVPPELSRGVTTRLFNTMAEAVSEGGTALNEFARVSGMSAESFGSSWGTADFGDTLLQFMQGLQKEGDAAVFTLHNLGITSVRDVPVLLRLAGAADEAGRAGGLLTQTMEDARQGWQDNSELALQYTKIAGTTSARIEVLGQNFEALFATMGQSSLGPLKELTNFLIDITQGLTAMAASPAGQFLGFFAVATSVAVGALFLLTAGLARGTAMSIGFSQAMQQASISATTAATATKAFNIALITTGIGAVVVLLGALATAFFAAGTGAQKTAGYIMDTSGLMAALKQDTEIGAKGFHVFRTEVSKTAKPVDEAAKKAENMTEVLHGIDGASKDAADGMSGMGGSAREASYIFGNATRDFLKSQLAMDKGFQDAMGDTALVEYWNTIGADMDEAIEVAATKGEAGLEDYFIRLRNKAIEEGKIPAMTAEGGFAPIDPNQVLGPIQSALAGTDSTIQGTINSFALLSDEVIEYRDANLLAAASDEELASANQELVDSMAAGMTSFADFGTVMSATQDRLKAGAEAQAEAYRKSMEDTDVALDESKDDWTDYYDGITFSLEEYLTSYRNAAAEQKLFQEQLTQLSGRGLSKEIIAELASMGPEAKPLVQALVDGTAAQLEEFEALWGKTGTDSATKYAAGLLAADIILKNAGRVIGGRGGESTKLAFLQEVAAGRTPFVEILKKYGLDAAGNPIPIQANDGPARDDVRGYLLWVAQQRANINVTASIINKGALENYLNSMNLSLSGKDRINAGQFYSGGYTGPGGKYQVAGTVHKDEFVFPKEAVRRIGVGNLYAQMRGAVGAVAAPSSSGYANGGLVTGGGSFATLDAQALQAILAVANRPIYLYTTDRVIAETAARGAADQTLLGTN